VGGQNSILDAQPWLVAADSGRNMVGPGESCSAFSTRPSSSATQLGPRLGTAGPADAGVGHRRFVSVSRDKIKPGHVEP